MNIRLDNVAQSTQGAQNAQNTQNAQNAQKHKIKKCTTQAASEQQGAKDQHCSTNKHGKKSMIMFFISIQ